MSRADTTSSQATHHSIKPLQRFVFLLAAASFFVVVILMCWGWRSNGLPIVAPFAAPFLTFAGAMVAVTITIIGWERIAVNSIAVDLAREYRQHATAKRALLGRAYDLYWQVESSQRGIGGVYPSAVGDALRRFEERFFETDVAASLNDGDHRAILNAVKGMRSDANIGSQKESGTLERWQVAQLYGSTVDGLGDIFEILGDTEQAEAAKALAEKGRQLIQSDYERSARSHTGL